MEPKKTDDKNFFLFQYELDDDSWTSCQIAIPQYMPDGRRPLCAVVYQEEQCSGAALQVENNNVTRRLSSDWIYEISSAQINSGCRLKVCTSSYFLGNCMNLPAESGDTDFVQLPPDFEYAIVSLSCVCDGDADHDGTPVLSTLRPDFYGRTTTTKVIHCNIRL